MAISANGSTVLVGARRDHIRVGGAYVFTRSGGTWTQQGERIVPSDEEGEGRFGEGVALSADGNLALIGGGYDSNLGAAWQFTRSGGTWTQRGDKLTASDELTTEKFPVGLFGHSIALSGDGSIALIAGPNDSGGRGAVWVFTRIGETWTQLTKLLGQGEASTEKKPGLFGSKSRSHRTPPPR